MYEYLKRNGENRTDAIRRISDGATIPFDEGNRDYRDYLEWIAAGNIPSEPASDA
jgi:hypothetical protein